MTWPFRIVLVLAIALPCSQLIAAENEDPSRLTVKRIFGAHEFESEHVSVRWMEDGARLHDTRAVEPARSAAATSFAMTPRPARPRSWSPPSFWCHPGDTHPSVSTIMLSPPTDRGS